MNHLPKNISLRPAVRQFLESGEIAGWVDGGWVKGTAGATFTTHDPGSGSPIAVVSAFSKEDVDRTVDVADRAFKQRAWAKLSPNDRSALIHRLADAVDAFVGGDAHDRMAAHDGAFKVGDLHDDFNFRVRILVCLLLRTWSTCSVKRVVFGLRPLHVEPMLS